MHIFFLIAFLSETFILQLHAFFIFRLTYLGRNVSIFNIKKYLLEKGVICDHLSLQRIILHNALDLERGRARFESNSAAPTFTLSRCL
uniref:Putative secreted protein n=1 Tax=Panstrongylus lignarius TaxID=156445 RepID=A0A224Y466_9HEMI